jgi:hypothetical protein
MPTFNQQFGPIEEVRGTGYAKSDRPVQMTLFSEDFGGMPSSEALADRCRHAEAQNRALTDEVRGLQTIKYDLESREDRIYGLISEMERLLTDEYEIIPESQESKWIQAVRVLMHERRLRAMEPRR